MFIGPARVAAQEEDRPQPPTDLADKKIIRANYENWLREMSKAADEVGLDEDGAETLDTEAKKILEDKGYEIVGPLPPNIMKLE